MIYLVAVNLKEIFKKGKSFEWMKPKICPNCNISHVWGHGFVLAFFDGFDKGVCLRRYRCPCCGCVIRMKPKGYFKRFQAPIEAIHNDIFHRIRTGKWPAGTSGPRRRHWMMALIKNIRLYFGNQFSDLIEGFKKMMDQGRIPVTRSI